VQNARAAKRSIAPDDRLPVPKLWPEPETRVQVANKTTLQASRRLVSVLKSFLLVTNGLG
jgi:hypothetical protein